MGRCSAETNRRIEAVTHLSNLHEQITKDESLEKFGFQIVHSLVDPQECDALSAELTALFERQQTSSRKKIGGVRNLLQLSSTVAKLASSADFVRLLENLTSRQCFPVRAIFFDKTREANWSVPWHQDLAIAVAERIETPGFGPWSLKEDVVHVQPPLPILESMITIRLSLDDCGAANGALKIIPGSHLCGELDMDEITRWTTRHESVVCEMAKGDALLMKPLLLHSSCRTDSPLHRRVLHIEYASKELPNGLRWFDSER